MFGEEPLVKGALVKIAFANALQWKRKADEEAAARELSTNVLTIFTNKK